MNWELHHAQGTALQRKSGWLEVKTLGSGGFGTVILWKHEESEQFIALKRCRLQSEMTPKHRDRWKLEIKIMKRLEHANVVKAVEVPPPLDVSSEEIPLLAMDYCAGGDLRKVLIDPENCCGMRENDIRCLAHDISSAVEYLHHNRIIHRDLKPENIVIQPGEEQKIYKLIDLGYAKELDQGSVCTSFVGTLQYLAPELFATQKYTGTVDYWSLGTVIFECITGFRPFLPTLLPIQWHKEVKRKSPEDICACYDMNGEVQFGKKLPGPNYLCRTMQAYFEQWLKMMLLWVSKERGGGLVHNRHKCFTFLDEMLSMKIVHVLNVATNQVLSYPVKEQQTISELQRILEQETKIAIADQDIVLASGVSPEPDHRAVQCCSQLGDEYWLVFLFRKGDSCIIQGSNFRKIMKPLPQMVQLIVKEPSTYLAFPEQKRAWAQSVYFCDEQLVDYRRLLSSQRAAMLSLLRINSIFMKLRSKMVNDFENLLGRIDYFKQSLKLDIEMYNEQSSGGVTSEKMYKRWQKVAEEVESFESLREMVSDLDQHCTALQTKIVELQKSPFARDKMNNTLLEMKEKSKGLFQDLRQATKEEREILRDHKHMVQAVAKVVYERDKSLQDLYTHLGKICSCKFEVNRVLPKISTRCTDITAASNQLIAYQKQRQADIWKLVQVGLHKGKQSSRQTSVEGSLLCSETGLESLRAMKENKDTSNRYGELFNSIQEEINQVHDSNSLWDFLSGNAV